VFKLVVEEKKKKRLEKHIQLCMFLTFWRKNEQVLRQQSYNRGSENWVIYIVYIYNLPFDESILLMDEGMNILTEVKLLQYVYTTL